MTSLDFWTKFVSKIMLLKCIIGSIGYVLQKFPSLNSVFMGCRIFWSTCPTPVGRWDSWTPLLSCKAWTIINDYYFFLYGLQPPQQQLPEWWWQGGWPVDARAVPESLRNSPHSQHGHLWRRGQRRGHWNHGFRLIRSTLLDSNFSF